MSDEQVESTQKDKDRDEDERGGNPVKEMFLLAALYLPLGFFLWFSFGSALMWLPSRIVEWALTGFFPDLFEGVVQLGLQLEIHTSIRMERMVDGRVALLNNDVNPMIYAWGMALLFGLIMATPMSAKRRALQLLIGYLVMSLVTAWGVFWQNWTDLAFRIGPEAAAAVAEAGLSPTLIALCYQLGYLMLPAVVPLATWILMNRPFLERVAFDHRRR
ncbi:MAG: exosortase H-associated membrane protein [Wenzhouxiangellaceae bacterium]